MTETVEAPTGIQTEIKPIHHWIGGKVYEGQSGRQRRRVQPGDRRAVRRRGLRLARGGRRGGAAAKEAFPAWRALSLSRRAELFFRIRQLFDDHRKDLARLLTLEHGKVLSDALGEVRAGSR